MKKFVSICLAIAIMLVGVGQSFAEEVYFYHSDSVGTPLAMTDTSGQKVWEADYKPFGEEFTVDASHENDKRFVGKEKDEETGLNYFGARYLSAKTGRFLAPDPVRAVEGSSGQVNQSMLANPQRISVYGYGLNNPYKFLDPDGRDIALVAGAPQGKNIFGHVGAGVTNKGTYSSGTKEALGSSFSSYLKDQSTYRDSTVYVFPTTQKQDEAFIEAFAKAKAEGHSATGNNCADILGDALKAADIIKDSAALKIPGLIESYLMRRASEGKVSSIVIINKGNKQWSKIDNHLKQFEPKKD
jgi:RHS repeat-associated protein